jgi:hypothetical protein
LAKYEALIAGARFASMYHSHARITTALDEGG